jgi:chromosome condensin MukBEF ATPase and DNA-binding subunit MukB
VKEADLDHDEARDLLESQIDALVSARDQSDDPDEIAAANEAIDLLQNEVDALNILAADELGPKVNEIIDRLDEILEENNLDAASALGRTFRRLRDLTEDPTAGGD